MADKPTKSHVIVSDPVERPVQPTVPANPEPSQTPDPAQIPADAPLSHTRITECAGPEACGLESKPWSGRDHWHCDLCGFDTFEQDEALGRKPSLAS